MDQMNLICFNIEKNILCRWQGRGNLILNVEKLLFWLPLIFKNDQGTMWPLGLNYTWHTFIYNALFHAALMLCIRHGSHSQGNFIFQDISRTELPFSRKNYIIIIIFGTASSSPLLAVSSAQFFFKF